MKNKYQTPQKHMSVFTLWQAISLTGGDAAFTTQLSKISNNDPLSMATLRRYKDGYGDISLPAYIVDFCINITEQALTQESA